MQELSLDKVYNILENFPLLKGYTLKSINGLRSVDNKDGKIKAVIDLPITEKESLDFLKKDITSYMKKNNIDVDVELNSKQAKELNSIKHYIAVMSGKGGVGKSFVSGLLAVYLERNGYNVGLLDADITGPSIPKMFGIKSDKTRVLEKAILPAFSKKDIKIMSTNLLLPEEDDAVIWRGPLISNVITQFFNDVLWGKLDYLIIDLPPGTSDASLTVLQTPPIDGVVMVFTPQDLTNMIVRKAVNMVGKLNKSIIALVENMSYFEHKGSDEKINIFGASKIEKMKELTSCDIGIKLPLNPKFSEHADGGNIEELDYPPFDEFAKKIAELVKDKKTS